MERRKTASFVSKGLPFIDPDWTKNYPLIWEHLTETAFSDGAPRMTSTMTFFCEPGLVKVCLSDREEGCTGWSTGESVKGALKGMEEALREGRMDWRPNRRPGKKA